MTAMHHAAGLILFGTLLASIASSHAAPERTRDFIRAGPDQSGQSAPEAADQTLGLAILSADIDQSGNLKGAQGSWGWSVWVSAHIG